MHNQSQGKRLRKQVPQHLNRRLVQIMHLAMRRRARQSWKTTVSDQDVQTRALWLNGVGNMKALQHEAHFSSAFKPISDEVRFRTVAQ